MNFFAPERPESSPGIKALLVDGSALPVVTVRVMDPERVQLLVMLRNYAAGSSFTYSYHYIDLKPTETSSFFASYIDDPEGTLERYCGWKPQAVNRSWSPNDTKKPQAARAPAAPPSVELEAMSDLL